MSGASTPARDATETKCLVCGSKRCITLLDKPVVPILSNRYYATMAAARAAPTGRLHIVTCTDCGFTFNRSFDPGRVVYDTDYENDQARSPQFLQHLDDVRSRLLGVISGDKAQILEVGCGQGEFLEALMVQGAGRIEAAIGYDTAWRGRPLRPGLRIEARKFDAASVREAAAFDIIYARHVIEHVADPVALLQAMAVALDEGGRVCIETPALEWILSTGQMQDFFYEHCNYFTAASLAEVFNRAGLGEVRIETVFGGQYLWAEGSLSQAATPMRPIIDHREIDGRFFPYWREQLDALRGPVGVWGAGAKGVTFATEVDPEGSKLACLVDVNPNKQGRFIPLSGHPIVPPETAARIGVATIIVMNPNYQDEIARRAASAGLRAVLLPCRHPAAVS